jgi:xylulokinase
MEGVVYSLRVCFQLIEGLGLRIDDLRATGGGGRSSTWRRLQADILGRDVHHAEVEEGPAYGAALLAAVGAGWFSDVAAAAGSVRIATAIEEPDPARTQLYEEQFRIYERVHDANADLMHSLADLQTA